MTTASRPRRPKKGRTASRYRQNVKEPIGRLRSRKAALEELMDSEHFDPTLSRSLDCVLVALESHQ